VRCRTNPLTFVRTVARVSCLPNQVSGAGATECLDFWLRRFSVCQAAWCMSRWGHVSSSYTTLASCGFEHGACFANVGEKTCAAIRAYGLPDQREAHSLPPHVAEPTPRLRRHGDPAPGRNRSVLTWRLAATANSQRIDMRKMSCMELSCASRIDICQLSWSSESGLTRIGGDRPQSGRHLLDHTSPSLSSKLGAR
jgi:hypothetical protein